MSTGSRMVTDKDRIGKLVCPPTTMLLPSRRRRPPTMIPSSSLTSMTLDSCGTDSAKGRALTGFRKKWCLDANAVAQEKGIEAVLAIVTNSGETSAKSVSWINSMR